MLTRSLDIWLEACNAVNEGDGRALVVIDGQTFHFKRCYTDGGDRNTCDVWTAETFDGATVLINPDKVSAVIIPAIEQELT